MASLYDITEQYRAMIEALAELEPDDPAIADTIEGADGVFDDKAVSVLAFARSLEAEAAAIKQAETDMAERRKRREEKAEKLREYVKTMMEAIGKKEIAHPWFDVKIKQNPASVVIDDESAVDAQYWRVPEPKAVIDKMAIKAAIEAGDQVTGAHIERGTRLEAK